MTDLAVGGRGWRPIQLLSTAVVLTATVLGWMTWRSYQAHHLALRQRERDAEIEGLREVIVHLAEVLTMSARMAAATGDPRWEERYRQNEPTLSEAIHRAARVAPDAAMSRAIDSLAAAKRKLKESEESALDLARKGQQIQARAVLETSEYQSSKSEYAAAIAHVSAYLEHVLQDARDASRQRAFVDVMAISIALAVLLVAWYLVLAQTRRWQLAQVATNRQLSAQKVALEELNRTLDDRVELRTRELEQSQEQLQRQAHELQRANQDLTKEIAERTNAQEALKVSGALYSSLVENLPVHVLRKDLEGRLTFANVSYCDLLGKAPHEILGRTEHQLQPGELAERHAGDERRIAQTGETIDEIEEHEVHGERRFFHVLKVPVHDAGGAIVGTQALFWDITEHRRAELALEREQALLQTLMESVPDSIYFKDRNSKFLRINRALAKRFGLQTPAQVEGKSDFDFFTREHAQQAWEDEQEVMRTGVPIVAKDEKETWPDGQVTWATTSKLPLRDPDGNIVGTFGISREVTEQVRARQALAEAKEAAEAASRAKSDFLANMSHEIRTPLNAVIGMTELVLDTELTAVQRDYLTMASESGEALLSVVNDVLDFSKIEAGRLELDHMPFNLREGLGDAMKSLAVRAHRKGLELACNIRPDVPATVIGDPVRLRQVIVNLVGNAVKFTHQGEIVLDVGLQEQAAEYVRLRFAVRDTGVGISQEQIGAVFDAFQQADSSKMNESEGTGLGLAISSRLVDLMGGRMVVESQIGCGSTFHFSVCFRPVSAEPDQNGRAQEHSLCGQDILVVDDNETNRDILRDMLRSWRIEPTLVASGAQALATLRQRQQTQTPFSLILVDASMPEMDGFGLITQVEREVGSPSPIIMMLTSGDRPRDIARCEHLGARAYLMKPIKQSELFDAIMLALGITTPEEESRLTPLPASAGGQLSLRVLVAEDSLVNQKLARALLEKWGHRVWIANNGKEAVAATQSHTFDLILMDVQMPEMDGLEATAVIRKRQTAGEARIPIVAMTAHAMTGDRERCLAAGMDAYVSKPVRTRKLAEVIDKLFATSSEAPAEDGYPVEPSAAAPFDCQAAVKGAGGKVEILKELAQIFFDECPQLMDAMRRAIDAGDATGLRRAAHTLKGAVDVFVAPAAYEAARKLEAFGKNNDLSQAGEVYAELEGQIEQLLPALKALS